MRLVDDRPLSDDEFARWWDETGERELRQLLYWKWDPIGVNSAFPRTLDEYDGYAPQIVMALRRDASPTEIAELLATYERDRMGLKAQPTERRLSLIAEIHAWYAGSQNSWLNFGPMRR